MAPLASSGDSVDPHVALPLQLALILGAARLCGELMNRIAQPAVLGELMAGIVLGPSLLGWLWPAGFSAVFHQQEALNHVSSVGLILLMLLVGLETDIRVLRHMGRAAFMASAFGMVVPFATGLALGSALDERFVLKGRLVLALFMATAMAISAMPVIAKILMDLGLMKRNFGILTLSAAVVDDTIGWIVLAVISGLATQGSYEVGALAATLGLLALFLFGVRFGLYPALRRLLPRAGHVLRLPGGELVLIVGVALVCAAITEAIHVHAVFGAFVAGVVFRQCPTLSSENLHRLEGVTMALFAPLFFGAVGLRVDFTCLEGFWLPLAVIGIAIAGKVGGCFLGGLLGRLPKWEALALGICMSARGAMGLVVAKVGLDLGVLNLELFSTIVLMAVVTSFLAPLLLRQMVRKLPLSEEEKLREKGVVEGFLPAAGLRILIPAAGGPNAPVGCHFAAHLCRSEGDRCTALHVETAPLAWWQRFARRRAPAGAFDVQAYFKSLQAAAGAFAARLSSRKVPVAGSVAETLLREAAKDSHFLVLGASQGEQALYDPFITEVVKKSPCHVVVVAGSRDPERAAPPFRRILVPTNGSYFSNCAFELAARYAEAAGGSLSVLYVAESSQLNPLLPAAATPGVTEHMGDLMRITLKEQFAERFAHPERLECHVRDGESVIAVLKEEVSRGHYDLVVLGAENKHFVERLYLGQHIEAAVSELTCAIALVIPKVGARRS